MIKIVLICLIALNVEAKTCTKPVIDKELQKLLDLRIELDTKLEKKELRLP